MRGRGLPLWANRRGQRGRTSSWMLSSACFRTDADSWWGSRWWAGGGEGLTTTEAKWRRPSQQRSKREAARGGWAQENATDKRPVEEAEEEQVLESPR